MGEAVLIETWETMVYLIYIYIFVEHPDKIMIRIIKRWFWTPTKNAVEIGKGRHCCGCYQCLSWSLETATFLQCGFDALEPSWQLIVVVSNSISSKARNCCHCCWHWDRPDLQLRTKVVCKSLRRNWSCTVWCLAVSICQSLSLGLQGLAHVGMGLYTIKNGRFNRHPMFQEFAHLLVIDFPQILSG